jgi:hypothetical protein
MQGKRNFSRESLRLVWLTLGIIVFLILGVLLAEHFTPMPVKQAHPGQPVVVPPPLTNDDDTVTLPLRQLNGR